MKSKSAVILFDGVCNLCNGFVQFVISHDPAGRFKFAALQSETGRQLLQKFQPGVYNLDTVILIENNKLYHRSTAALRILRHLSGAWPLLYLAIILPVFFRDWGYNFVARNRYRWLGQRESCLMPTPGLKARFL
ncbi:thiol-disulfide oxidoreductase DCC family protein [Adhaeribacter rhizoryzae]|uniref:Thiol-disulfide oxidoreductase DCC family protein n=1 Tax=Adhaeribacter rhizoryzae TaxID=2607907 RepID=A0A5M6D9A9_9BACT|nr:thiol-disulfide oxidoreductase DCC family protein [Adhaeribacter rhizoryzae]KAA5543943.1 thiol-disulfide oxidoreductase DCC family protein [Adhaeribacter rhizoryzae]